MYEASLNHSLWNYIWVSACIRQIDLPFLDHLSTMKQYEHLSTSSSLAFYAKLLLVIFCYSFSNTQITLSEISYRI